MIQHIATLYKRGRTDFVQWVIKIESLNRKINLMIAYGTVNGVQAVRYQNDIKGKNIGKANETSSWEQAELEAQSRINLKLKEGYVKDSDIFNEGEVITDLISILDARLPEYNTDVNGNDIPMKCQQYYRSKKDWKSPEGIMWEDRKYYYLINPYVDKDPTAIVSVFPSYIQPKINGVRAFIKETKDGIVIFSKKGLTYNLPHIVEYIKEINLFREFPENTILDGELYIPGESLQNIGSAVKTNQFSTLSVQFHLFDLAIADMVQTERFAELYKPTVKEKLNGVNAAVVLVPGKRVVNDARVQVLTDEYIAQGYEGSIIRDYNGLYEFGKRPKTITKLKRTTDEEFMIVDIIRAEKDPSCGLFVCVTSEGKEFKVNPKGTIEYKKEVLLNREYYIGKELTCVFYEYTDDGIPFHIMNNIVRDYE